METLKERAIQNLIYEQDFCGRNLSDDMVCRAYVKGATDQKAIDIDKACEWLGPHLAEVADRYDSTASLLLRLVKENFRKAMEREL